MAEHAYHATVRWRREGAVYTDGKYSRAHTWIFDDGCEVPASASPLVMKPPLSRTDAVDPEEALVAALSSCHMLFFLHLAMMKGFTVDSYEDRAVGVMTKNERGKLFMSKVTLDPQIVWSGDKRPAADDIARLHHRAHEECYIANSVRTEVVIAGVPDHA